MGRAGSAAELRALALANLRFWPTVAPLMWRELEHWRVEASAIGDPLLRELALSKLAREGFNAEVAATLATLAPRPMRAPAAQAIVALEVLFDYLDGRTERAETLEDGFRAFEPFIAAIAGGEPLQRGSDVDQDGDESYVWALSEYVARHASVLPSFAATHQTATLALGRCAQAQVRLHAAASTGDQQLREWAERESTGSGLSWRQYTGGCASSVLAVHALIAAAARPGLDPRQAAQIDRAYLSIGALITTLDSLVDRERDVAAGQRGFIDVYGQDKEIGQSVTALTGQALSLAQASPDGAHHAMTLAGVAAYYTSHPGGRDPRLQPIVAAVRRELSPTIWPALGVMRIWRAGKHLKARDAALRHVRAGAQGTDDQRRWGA